MALQGFTLLVIELKRRLRLLVRHVRGGGSDDITILRKSGNAGLNGVANALFGTSYTDLCYGYNAFWIDILPVLDLPDTRTPAPPEGMLWGDGFEIETLGDLVYTARLHDVAETDEGSLGQIAVAKVVFEVLADAGFV